MNLEEAKEGLEECIRVIDRDKDGKRIATLIDFISLDDVMEVLRGGAFISQGEKFDIEIRRKKMTRNKTKKNQSEKKYQNRYQQKSIKNLLNIY